MKKIIFSLGLVICIFKCEAQHATIRQSTDTATEKKDLFKHLKIGQSMETAEYRQEPAQMLITFPENEKATLMMDMGISYDLSSKSNNRDPRLTAKIIAEFHRKTQTDEKQNNFQLGVGYFYKLSSRSANKINYYMEGDIKYAYDGISLTNSAVGDAMITAYRAPTDSIKYMHWNVPNFFGHFSVFLSPHCGVQLQQVFKASEEKKTMEGFILRPLFDVQTVIRLNQFAAQNNPFPDFYRRLELSLKYVGRYDAINTTSASEGYTNLFSAAIRYFPFNSLSAKASVGISYNKGSDPVKGLGNQSYWLLSVNLSK